MILRLSSGCLWATSLVALIGAVVQPSPCCAEESILLGALYNSTGPQAGLDVPSAQGAQLAVSQANRDGGLLGRRVVLDIRDGKSEAATVKEMTAELLALKPQPIALFGLSDTDLVLAAAPLAARSKRVFLTSGATSPRLPAEVPEYLYLACFGDNLQASAAAEWAHNDRTARTAVILFDSSHAYTRLLQGYFATRFQELGGKVAIKRSFTSDTLEKSLDDLPTADVVFLAAEDPADIQNAVRLLRESGVACPILGGDSFDSQGLWDELPEVDDVYYTTHAFLGEDNSNPQVVAFRQAYIEAYPGSIPDAFAALGYDAARLLMAAIEQADSDDPAAVRQALAGIRQYEGVSGAMSYPTGSRIPTKSVSLIGVTGGKLRLISEVIPKSIPSP